MKYIIQKLYIFQKDLLFENFRIMSLKFYQSLYRSVFGNPPTNDSLVCLTRLSVMFTEYKRQRKINLHDANEARTPLPCWSPRNAICVFAARFLERESVEAEGRKYLPDVQRARKNAEARLLEPGIISCGFLRSLRDFHLDAVRYASPFIVSRDADPVGFFIGISERREYVLRKRLDRFESVPLKAR